MIYSGVDENWMRVEMMHAIAKEYYDKTKGSEYREHRLNPSNRFFIDLEKSMLMDKEACVVGMVVVWSVVTLESLINHVIAEKSENESDAITAIEYPQNLKITEEVKSLLAKKMVILSQPNTVDKRLLKIADDISNVRNEIVHDKPFEYLDYGDGDIEIRHYRKRGNSENKQYTFEYLSSFYKQCHDLCSFIDSYYIYFSPMDGRVCFDKLLSG
ncbi:MAG: hypothetical protein K9L79_16230 [Methylobacter tundripaludum]|nr:hypothetical protein [Methylobacter tundripaludum]